MGTIAFLFTLCKNEKGGAVVQKTKQYVMIKTQSKRVKYDYVFGFEDFLKKEELSCYEVSEDLTIKTTTLSEVPRYLKICLAEKRTLDIKDSLAWFKAEEYKKIVSLLMLSEKKNTKEELLKRTNELRNHFTSLYSKDNIFKV